MRAAATADRDESPLSQIRSRAWCGWPSIGARRIAEDGSNQASYNATMRRSAAAIAFLFASTAAAFAQQGAARRLANDRPPNLVVIFVDDMGYADIGPFGSKTPTPSIDRIAKEGMRFTDFHASSAVCSASRAALMTGCSHARVSVHGAYGPDATQGIAASETTLAEICKQKGYATACFGKWHLGLHPKFLPLQHGFDEYFGLPYSNDMWPSHPDYANLPKDAAAKKKGYPTLPLIDGNKVVDPEVTAEDQKELTRRYTDRAVDFIRHNMAKSFFLYVPHTMAHVPLFASKEFEGSTKKGIYADVVAEVDESVRRILEALDQGGIANNTLVVFTSDNGPWLSYGDHAGSAGPLREGKGTSWEGGHRVPCVMRWPARIPAGTTCDQLAITYDLLPTFAATIGAKLPDHTIDGRDISKLMRGEKGATTPHEAFYCYYSGQLQAVRDQRWKLVLPHSYATLAGASGGTGGSPAPYQRRKTELALYDLANDIGETKDVAAKHPEIVERLSQWAERAREDLGDSIQKRTGSGVRPAGKLNDGDAKLAW